MGKFYDRVHEEVQAGQAGLRKGLLYNKKRLELLMGPIQRKYHLFYAGTGVGKTAFVDDMMLYGAMEYAVANPEFNYTIDYYSFEVPAWEKFGKFAVRKIWQNYGVRINVEDLFSMRRSRLSNEYYELFKETREYFEPLEDKIRFFDEGTPKSILENSVELLEKRGTVFKKTHISKNGEEKYVFDTFKYHKPLDYHNVIVDHAALTDTEGGGLKDTIDELSKNLNTLRRRYGSIVTLIQQQNFDQTSVERQRNPDHISPRLSDLGDSRYTSRDAEVAFSIFSPYQIMLPTHDAFNINQQWRDSFRQLELQKGRNTGPGARVNFFYDGLTGMFYEIPYDPRKQDLTAEQRSQMGIINSLSFQNELDNENRNSRAEWFRQNDINDARIAAEAGDQY